MSGAERLGTFFSAYNEAGGAEPVSQKVEVEIVAPADAQRFVAATAHLRVEDVREADAPAQVVAETTLRGVELAPDGRLFAEVEVPEGALRPGGEYTVRVVVERRGDGMVRSGDCVSFQRHPVHAAGGRRRLVVPLRAVP